MKTRKMIAALLVFCLLFCELPAAGVMTAFAAGPQISYSRMDPEVVILNAYTGSDSDFYAKVQSDPDYNFADRISSLGYKKTISDDTTVRYENFGNTVLNKLSNQFYNQMEASYSATFSNKNGHTHAIGLITIDTSYISSVMHINGTTVSRPTGLGGISSKITRQGNGKFSNYYSGSGNLSITYQNSIRLYTVLTGKEYKCTCGGDAYNHTILFRDKVAPFVMRTEILDASGNKASEFKAGDKIVIKLTCSEPLRLAGDAVPANDICIGLKVDGGGSGDQLIAKMTSLATVAGSMSYDPANVSEMTFEFTVPQSLAGKVFSITGLDFAPSNLGSGQTALYDKKGNIGLVMVGNSKKLTLASDKGVGYTRTYSYVTDLAGNALADTDASCRFYIDAQAPFVAEYDASASTNNADVKEALGKSGMDPRDRVYADASDSNLGVGDSITFSAYMNEIISAGSGATITTNLLDRNGQAVTSSSVYALSGGASGSEYGKGSSAGRVTVIGFAPIMIREGMTIAGGGDTIKVTDISFSSLPADKAGNGFVKNSVSAAAQNYKLDVTAPAAETANGAKQAGYDYKSYVFDFTVTDNILGGTASLGGSFNWHQDMCTAPYEYALTASSGAPAQGEWKTASMGSAVTFTQTGAAQYLHLRPIEGQEYDIHSSTLSFTLRDYAGNQGTSEFRLDGSSGAGSISFDTVPPVVTRGTDSRAYDSAAGKGTLTVTINITDGGKALSDPIPDEDRPMYLWAVTNAAISTESPGWQPLEGEIDGSNTVFSLTAVVDNGTAFEKDLYVKACDSFGNVGAPVKLGMYTYNLGSINYDLDCSKAVTTVADMKVRALGTDGFLFFYIPTGMGSELGDYYGTLVDAVSGNIFTYRKDWNRYNLELSGGDMIFTKVGDMVSFTKGWPYDPINKDFTGIIDVNVVSGYADSVKDEDGVLTISDDKKPYGRSMQKLYVVEDYTHSYTPVGYGENEHKYTGVFDSLLDVSLTSLSETKLNIHYNYSWDPTKECVMKTPAGLPFAVNISARTGCEWALDDIDMSGSKILIYRGGGNTEGSYEHIGEIPLGSSFTQTIYLPELDYGKGDLHLQLLLKRKAGSTYRYYSNAGCIIDMFTDDSAPSDNFELANVIHTYDLVNLRYPDNFVPYSLTVDEIFTDMPVDKSPYTQENGAEMIIPFYSYNGEAASYADMNSKVYLAVSSEESAKINTYGFGSAYTGSWVLQAWNVTTGSEEKVLLDAEYLTDEDDVTEGFRYLTEIPGKPHGGKLKLEPADSDAAARALDKNGVLGVTFGKVNIIAIRRVNQNGSVSSVKYYAVYPKKVTDYPVITPYVDGEEVSVHGDALGTEISYTVQFGSMNDCSVFVDPGNAGERKELMRDASGVCSYTAGPREVTATFLMKDEYGIGLPLGIFSGFRTDHTAPVINSISKGEDPLKFTNGYFTAIFQVMDDTFRPEFAGEFFAPVIHLGFDEDYSKVLGVLAGDALDIDLISYGGANEYFWTTDGEDKTGIAEVYAVLDEDGVLQVEVRGFVSPKLTSSNPMNIGLSIAATDIFGNRSEGLTVTADNAYGVGPELVYAEVGGNPDAQIPDYTMCATFSAPVQPAESWINRDIEGFSVSWWDAFPITKDGEWDITFTDIFGITYDQTINIPESESNFGSDGFDLYISTLEPTGGDVTISAATDDGMDWFIIGTMSADGKISWPAVAPAPSVTMNASENGCYVVLRLDNNHNGEPVTNAFDFRDCTFIHLNNVAKAAPEAELNFYFEEFGDSFTPEELRSRFPGGVTTGDFVRVSYDTARHVTASGETEHVFAYGGATSCSFSYTDDFGHAGGAKVDLADYGITLAAPPEPYKDVEVPLVSVDIYARRSGAYVPSEFFSAGDSPERVSEAFADTSYVQDYSLSLGVQDYSSCRILLLSSEPTSLSYSSESDYSNASVTLSGNSIHISKEFRTDGTDFWVAVVDNAMEETGAPADNFTGFMVRKGVLAEWFDNKKPVLTETKEIADSLYQHTLYLKLDDKADDGKSTPSDSLSISGTAVRRNEKTDGLYSKANFPYCITFNSNSDIPVTIMDAAGNYILSMMRPLTAIDDSEPVLNIEWSPGLSTEAGIDPAQPTDGPVNTEVTAHIYSDKPIDISPAATKLEYLVGGNYYPLSGSESSKKISWDATAQRVTVTFAGEESCGQQLRVTVYAPNGRFAQTYLQLPYGAIDKSAPGRDLDVSPLKRSSAFTVPYGLNYTLWPKEPVYIDGIRYNQYLPYRIELIGKSKKDITLTDLAGNISICTLNTETDFGVAADNTAPVITFNDPVSGDLSELNASGGTVTATLRSDEDCVLRYTDGGSQKELSMTAGTDRKVSFTSNGTRTLRFTDDAGNESSLTLTVSTIDNIIPVITMSTTTVSLVQGASAEELEAALSSGVTASDNSGNVTLTHDSSAVKPGVPGNYTVVYTAEDGSGNKATARRTVKVISRDLPQVRIDGQLLESGGVISIAPGRHTLAVSNLRESGEPYKLTIVRGIYYDGQMKYLNNQVSVASDGSFTVDTEGFYTFYLQTQSRQSLRCLIDVEK